MYLGKKSPRILHYAGREQYVYYLIIFAAILHTGLAAIENILNNQRTLFKLGRNSVFDCHLSPVGRLLPIRCVFARSASFVVLQCFVSPEHLAHGEL